VERCETFVAGRAPKKATTAMPQLKKIKEKKNKEIFSKNG